jgi:hypothetical protein
MTRSSRGLTLLEVLILIVIIGGLAPLAATRYRGTRGSPYVSITRSELPQLATVQEAPRPVLRRPGAQRRRGDRHVRRRHDHPGGRLADRLGPVASHAALPGRQLRAALRDRAPPSPPTPSRARFPAAST